ncbi:MAG: hypothetical protein J6X67_00470 [Treponema sp.]|nr:hypothetical protein [Treponema sp.]
MKVYQLSRSQGVCRSIPCRSMGFEIYRGIVFYLRALIVFLAFSFFLAGNLFSQEKTGISLEFKNQEITDILFALSELCGESILPDETVKGKINFQFHDKDFKSALDRFCSSANLYVTENKGVYEISRVSISKVGEKWAAYCDDADVSQFLTILSRKTSTTIMYDPLPNTGVSLRIKEADLDEILSLVMLKLNGFSLDVSSGGYYIGKSGTTSRRGTESFTLKQAGKGKDALYTLALRQASLEKLIESLFKKAGEEYSLIDTSGVTLQNMFYKDKTFAELLSLILENSSCDCSVNGGIYYIYGIQKKDVLKKFKETDIIKLTNINAEALLSLFPAELNPQSFIRIDKKNNSIILTGSDAETKPIRDFIERIDVATPGLHYARFQLHSIDVKEATSCIPKDFYYSQLIIVPGTKSFIAEVDDEKEKKLTEYMGLIDRKDSSRAVHLKYIKSEELQNHLLPSITKDNITQTGDSSLIFFTGSDESFAKFKEELALVDKPRKQIRYQILVIQHQKTDGFNWSPSFAGTKGEGGKTALHSVSLSNLLDINFDIVAKFGMQFAGNLNAQIENGLSRVLADTTLSALSGEKVTFSNTNIYRYRDVVMSKSDDVYTTTTREISSGLNLNINGWVSGDGMVTVGVEASVSKQGTADPSGNGAPPSTSEKKVTTNVRTKSGEPVIIGGLIQKEKDENEKGTPLVSRIPILGNLFKSRVDSRADTELVIYLVPFIEEGDMEKDDVLERYWNKYIAGALPQ